MKKVVSSNKKTFIVLGILIAILAMVLPVIFVSDRRDTQVLGKTEKRIMDFDHTSTNKQWNQNIQISNSAANPSVKSLVNGNVEVPVTNTSTTNPIQTDSGNNVLAANTLVIPRLNINTRVIEEIDGEKAIHEGAWLYPSSYEGDGEKILLGHRRYWGADDPRSFWNLDLLKNGDIIKYADKNGDVYNYVVRSVSVRNAGDLSILKPSKENIIKVISCSTADGSAGSSEKRIVVIASQI